jgi:hypothetical protein
MIIHLVEKLHTNLKLNCYGILVPIELLFLLLLMLELLFLAELLLLAELLVFSGLPVAAKVASRVAARDATATFFGC